MCETTAGVAGGCLISMKRDDVGPTKRPECGKERTLTERKMDRQTKQMDRKTDKQRQTVRQKGRWTERQTGRWRVRERDRLVGRGQAFLFMAYIGP